ncbi:MAG: hypothetical protein ABSB35_36130 [Bryobacteraceae bacterium]|jgi:hypothetical protein
MRPKPHDRHAAKRAVFWLVLASTFIVGLLLLFYVPNHKVSAGLALGVMAVLVLKHVGLLMLLGPLLAGALNMANTRAKGLLRKYVCKV